MLEFLVNNTYISVMGACFQQVIRIPMGTNSGVNIVDFYLSSYELDFMQQLIRLKKWVLLGKFGNTMRFVDDIISVDNELFNLALSGRFSRWS